MKRGLLVVAMALLMVLAGCNGGPGGGTATPTDESGTDADSSDGGDGDSSDGGDGGAMASGMTDLDGVSESEGVFNSTAIVRGSFDTLNSPDSQFVESTEVSAGDMGISYVYTNGSDADAFSFTNQTTGETVEFWASESITAQRNESSTPPITIGQGDTSVATSFAFTQLFRAVAIASFSRTELSAAGTSTLDGEELFRFSVDAYNQSEEQSFSLLENATAVSGTILVDSNGVMRQAGVVATLESNGETRQATINYSVSEVGSATASQPDWLTDVPRASLSTESGGNVLTFSPEGSTTIPAGTRIEVGRAFATSPYGNVTLSDDLTSSDTLYVVSGGSFNDKTVAAQIGQQPQIPDNPDSFEESSIGLTMTVDNRELQYALPGDG